MRRPYVERRRVVKFKPVKIINRGNSYQLYYYNPRGERRRISVGNDHQQAQRLALRFTDWLMEGKDPEREVNNAQHSEQSKAITISDFFPTFIERHGTIRSKKMQLSYQNSFKNICRCPLIVDAEIGSLSKSFVLDYMHERMKMDGVKAATVNKDAAFLKCMLSKAVEWDILDHNPLQGLKLFKDDGKRDVYLSHQQAISIINELPVSLANIVEFAIYTGFRKENILSLLFESVRFHDLTPTGEVDLIVKGGNRELFPLGPAAIEVLKRAIGDRVEGYIFINPETNTRYVSIHKTFDRVVRRLGIIINNGTKLRIHDLRHVFATWLHREGVSLDELRFLLGHKDRATTDRYTSVDRLETGKVLNMMPNLRELSSKKNLGLKKDKALL